MNILRKILAVAASVIGFTAFGQAPTNVQKTTGTNVITAPIVIGAPGEAVTTSGVLSLQGGTFSFSSGTFTGSAPFIDGSLISGTLPGGPFLPSTWTGSATLSQLAQQVFLNIDATQSAVIAGQIGGGINIGNVLVNGAEFSSLSLSSLFGSSILVSGGAVSLTGSGALAFNGFTLSLSANGTLGSNAFTSTAFLPLAGGTLTGAFTDTLGAVTTGSISSTTGTFSALLAANGGVVATAATVSGGLTVTGSSTLSQIISTTINQTPGTVLSIGTHSNFSNLIGASASTQGSSGVAFETGFGTFTNSGTATGSSAALEDTFTLFGTTFSALNTAVTTSQAATLLITGPAMAGTHMTITNPRSILVLSGISEFDGPVTATTLNGLNIPTQTGTLSLGTGTLSLASGTALLLAGTEAILAANTFTGSQTMSASVTHSSTTNLVGTTTFGGTIDTPLTGSQYVVTTATGSLTTTSSAGGSGTVTQVTSTAGSLVVTNTTSTPNVEINLAHANTFTASQTISGAVMTLTTSTQALAVTGTSSFAGSTTISANVAPATLSAPMFISQTNSTGSPLVFTGMAPNIVAGNSLSLGLGAAASNFNTVFFGFGYVNSGTTSNNLNVSFYGNSAIMKLDANGTETLSGGLFTGTTSVTTLTASTVSTSGNATISGTLQTGALTGTTVSLSGAETVSGLLTTNTISGPQSSATISGIVTASGSTMLLTFPSLTSAATLAMTASVSVGTSGFSATNSSTSTFASTGVNLYNSGGGQGGFIKQPLTYGGAGIFSSRDLGFFNDTGGGNIDFWNETTTGSIIMAAGGSSTVQWKLSNAGNVTLTGSETVNGAFTATGAGTISGSFVASSSAAITGAVTMSNALIAMTGIPTIAGIDYVELTSTNSLGEAAIVSDPRAKDIAAGPFPHGLADLDAAVDAGATIAFRWKTPSPIPGLAIDGNPHLGLNAKILFDVDPRFVGQTGGPDNWLTVDMDSIRAQLAWHMQSIRDLDTKVDAGSRPDWIARALALLALAVATGAFLRRK